MNKEVLTIAAQQTLSLLGLTQNRPSVVAIAHAHCALKYCLRQCGVVGVAGNKLPADGTNIP